MEIHFSKISDSMKMKLLEQWKKNYDGYKFTNDQIDLIFDPSKIIKDLQFIQKKMLKNQNVDEIANQLLTQESTNKNENEMVLSSLDIVSIKLTKIITELLNENFTICEDGIDKEFHFNAITFTHSSLCSYLFYIGKLTLSDQQNVRFPDVSLKIPNYNSRKDIIKEGLSIKNWTESDLISIRSSIMNMLINRDIKSFCDIIDEFQLSRLTRDEIILHLDPQYGLSPLIQCFIDAITFSFFTIKNEIPSYKIKMHEYGLQLTFNKYPNLKIGIVFAGISIFDFERNDYPSILDIHVKCSEALKNLSDEEFLKLDLIGPYGFHSTVSEQFENVIQRGIEFKEELKDDFENEVVVFVIFRGGHRKLLFKKLE